MRRCKSICWNNIQIMIEEEYHKSPVLHIWSWTQCHTNAPSDATGLSVLMNCWATSAADAVNVNGRTLSMKRPLTRRASWWDVRSYVPKVYSKTFSSKNKRPHKKRQIKRPFTFSLPLNCLWSGSLFSLMFVLHVLGNHQHLKASSKWEYFGELSL